jgi:hypothetical protein
MKKFLHNIFLIIALLVLLLNLFDFIRPYYYGNHYYVSKMEVYQNTYDVVFFGSSRVHNQINPSTFDSITSNINLNSYNLGTQACFSPESYYLADKFIASQDSNKIKYLFLELQKLSDIDPSNSLTHRGYYWNSISEMSFIFSYLKNDNTISTLKKTKIFTKYLCSYFYKQIDVTRISSIFNKSSQDPLEYSNGFRPLLTKSSKDSSFFFQNLKALVELNEKVGNYSTLNKGHIARLNNLIESGKQKGIKVYFILSPKWKNYEFALEIMNGLDSNRIIDMTKSKNIQQYYLPKYSYDAAHFNLEGSNMYTEDLANEFLKRINF